MKIKLLKKKRGLKLVIPVEYSTWRNSSRWAVQLVSVDGNQWDMVCGLSRKSAVETAKDFSVFSGAKYVPPEKRYSISYRCGCSEGVWPKPSATERSKARRRDCDACIGRETLDDWEKFGH